MFKHILVPLDGSTLAECVLSHAITLARVFEAKITLLRVLECPPHEMVPVDPLTWQMYKIESEVYLHGKEDLIDRAGISVTSVILEGPAARSTVEFAQRNEVDLIILSSHGESGISGWNIGSVVRKILQHARLSIMIVRAYQPTTDTVTGRHYARLLVPMDGSKRAECVLPVVLRLGHTEHAEIVLTHAVCSPEMPRTACPTREDQQLASQIVERNRKEAQKYLLQLEEQLHNSVQTRLVVTQDVAVSLHEMAEAEHIDLIVLSAHGYSGTRKWPYGSVTNSFIEYGSLPLLIIQDLSLEEVEETKAEAAAREYKGH